MFGNLTGCVFCCLRCMFVLVALQVVCLHIGLILLFHCFDGLVYLLRICFVLVALRMVILCLLLVGFGVCWIA